MVWKLGGNFNLKGIASFTVEPKIYEEFERIIPSNTKSRVIEFLIKGFLEKTKSEQKSILAQIHAKSAKNGDY